MTDATQPDPRRTLLDAPQSRYQWAAIGVTVMLCALDGFDVLAVTYAAPGFLQEWGLSNAELGLALSMGLVGMALGSFFLAPLADVIGRRNMIFACLLVMAAGMTATAFCGSLATLAGWRLVTGLGIGAMISIIVPLAAEYSNARRRDFAVGLMAVGYPIGGTFGGLAAAQLLVAYDWRAIFIFGGVIAVVILPLVIRWMPEPVGYLIDNPKPDTLEKVNRFLTRCGHAPVNALPPPSPRSGAVPITEILGAGNRGRTLHITALYSLAFTTIYFFLTWSPKLVTDLGFSAATSTLVAVTRDMVGIFGGLLLGWAAHYLGLKRLVVPVVAGMGLALILFGRLPADIVQLRGAAALAGLCLYGSAVGLYAVLARSFDTHVRATGTGFVIGMGRIASAIAPLLGGYLFSIGWDRAEVTSALGMGAIVAALLLVLFPVRPIGVH